MMSITIRSTFRDSPRSTSSKKETKQTLFSLRAAESPQIGMNSLERMLLMELVLQALNLKKMDFE